MLVIGQAQSCVKLKAIGVYTESQDQVGLIEDLQGESGNYLICLAKQPNCKI